MKVFTFTFASVLMHSLLKQDILLPREIAGQLHCSMIKATWPTIEVMLRFIVSFGRGVAGGMGCDRVRECEAREGEAGVGRFDFPKFSLIFAPRVSIILFYI